MLKEVYNYTDQECAQVCGCQEHNMFFIFPVLFFLFFLFSFLSPFFFFFIFFFFFSFSSRPSRRQNQQNIVEKFLLLKERFFCENLIFGPRFGGKVRVFHFLFSFFHFFRFLSFSFIFYHFRSFSFIFFHFRSFSFIFFHFFVGCSKSDFFWASISLRFLLTVLM